MIKAAMHICIYIYIYAVAVPVVAVAVAVPMVLALVLVLGVLSYIYWIFSEVGERDRKEKTIFLSLCLYL